jgi:hypothetical protein
MSLDCGESYHGSNSSPSSAMLVIVVTTFCADGLRRSVPRAYVSKLDVLVLKNSPCQVAIRLFLIIVALLVLCKDRPGCGIFWMLWCVAASR